MNTFQAHGTNREGFTFLVTESTLEAAISAVETMNPFSCRLVGYIQGQKSFSMNRSKEGMWNFVQG